MFNELSFIEEKVTLSIDLLEIARNYCKCNFDKGQEVVAIGTILKIVLDEQKELADKIDEIL